MIEKQLRDETEKWLGKIKKEIKDVRVERSKENFLKNINAYISDCEYYLKQKKLILAFEAVIWAWSWLTILKELGIIKTA